MQHIPVLRDSLIEALVTRSDGIYVDATYGRGGHARALLGRLSEKARLFVIDRDPAAVESANELSNIDGRVIPIHATFTKIPAALEEFELSSVSGVMLDVGVSSPQLDDPTRGFSFKENGPLDMRMDPTKGLSVADWLTTVEEKELAQIIWKYGQERDSRRIARAIIQGLPLLTTGQLVETVTRAKSENKKNKHPATRTFQALRIFINDELEELKQGIEAAFEYLEPAGRLAVLTFHSLEHSIVRRRFREWAKPNLPRRLPMRGKLPSAANYIVKAVRPPDWEITNNPRARSALLQVIEKSD